MAVHSRVSAAIQGPSGTVTDSTKYFIEHAIASLRGITGLVLGIVVTVVTVVVVVASFSTQVTNFFLSLQLF